MEDLIYEIDQIMRKGLLIFITTILLLQTIACNHANISEGTFISDTSKKVETPKKVASVSHHFYINNNYYLLIACVVYAEEQKHKIDWKDQDTFLNILGKFHENLPADKSKIDSVIDKYTLNNIHFNSNETRAYAQGFVTCYEIVENEILPKLIQIQILMR